MWLAIALLDLLVTVKNKIGPSNWTIDVVYDRANLLKTRVV